MVSFTTMCGESGVRTFSVVHISGPIPQSLTVQEKNPNGPDIFCRRCIPYLILEGFLLTFAPENFEVI